MSNKVASTDLIELYEGDDYTGRYHDAAGERISRIIDKLTFNKNDKVLDIGCGNGLLLPEIINKIAYYDGIDFSKRFINDARKRAAKSKLNKRQYTYFVGDVVKFCKTHKGYDKVFALDFTEHINDEELNHIFKSVKQSMKKGSQLIIHTPNKDYLLERIKSNEQKIKVQGHIGLRNSEEYKKLFKQTGFKKVEVIPLNHYLSILKPFHLFSHIPIKKISSLFQARLLIICEA